MSKIKPLHGRIVIKPLVKDALSAGGIVLSSQPSESHDRALVIEAADDSYVKKGDTVLYGRYSCISVELDDEPLLIINEKDILAIIS
jgi:chaperonin GroES